MNSKLSLSIYFKSREGNFNHEQAVQEFFQVLVPGGYFSEVNIK